MIPKEIFVVKNRIPVQAAMSACSDAAVSTAILFRKLLQKIQMVESFLWSHYRLTVQSSDYIKMNSPRMFSWKSSESFRRA